MVAHLRALVVDDEPNIRYTLALALEKMGCAPATAASAQTALAALRRETFDLVLLDVRLGDVDGLRLLPKLLAESTGLAVVVMTAQAALEDAVEAVRGGALDYLAKPFSARQLEAIVERVTAARRGDGGGAPREHLGADAADLELDTSSPRMRELLRVLERAAPADVSVLLRGESGTGKGVLARWLHARSSRSRRPFVVVNCPTLSSELLASELFGHARGAFTDAVRDQPGIVEAADGGTLFLDEITEIAPPVQAKLLRFVQDREFERVGESQTRHADVRVIAATNRDVEAEVAMGRFRSDLLYRLNVVEVAIPPLRDRPEDMPRLARKLVTLVSQQIRRGVPELPQSSIDLLASYDWPGNVRELRNVLERAVLLWPGDVLEPEAFPRRIRSARLSGPRPGDEVTIDELEREHIERVIARAPTFAEAARILGIDESTLRRKRNRYRAPAASPGPPADDERASSAAR